MPHPCVALSSVMGKRCNNNINGGCQYPLKIKIVLDKGYIVLIAFFGIFASADTRQIIASVRYEEDFLVLRAPSPSRTTCMDFSRNRVVAYSLEYNRFNIIPAVSGE